MATYKLNIGTIRGCPAPGELLQAIQGFGLPETEEYGVLNCSATDGAVFATIVRKTQQAVPKLDADTQEVTAAPVERVTVYPLAVRPAQERLEIYAGAASSVEQAGVFFSSCLALPTVVEPIEVDIPAAVEKLAKTTQRFQLRAIRVREYAHNAYMAGTYAPKFLDTEHGTDFLAEYAESVAGASVRFQGPTGRVTVGLSGQAAFSFSCAEEDLAAVRAILRKLV